MCLSVQDSLKGDIGGEGGSLFFDCCFFIALVCSLNILIYSESFVKSIKDSIYSYLYILTTSGPLSGF